MMKLIKLLMLFCIGAFFIASTAQGQINPTIAVLPANSGVVTVGATLDLQITVGNTGTANVVASKLRPVITVPSSVTLLADGSQTGLPSGWIIVAGSNTGSQIRICNNTDVIAGGTSRNIIIKVQGVTVSPAQTFSGQLTFGGATCSVTGAQPSGNIGADDLSTSTITVQAAAACAITASASAGIIACNGGTTTLTATAAGAVGAVEYSLNGGAYQPSNTFTVNAAGSPYVVIAREVATPTCSATAAAVTVTQPTAIVANASATNVSALGGTNGTATVVASAGTSPYTYAWAPGGQTSATATGLSAGTYTVTVTDANLCTQTVSATVGTAACTIAVTASAGSIACNGGTTTLTATATGASGTVQYSLNGGAFQAGNTFTVNAAGSPYTVTAREVANTSCSANAAAVTVSQPAALVASSSNTAILCNGGNSTVTVSATGGTAPYTGTGSFIRTTGAYSYTVTDANNCTSITTGTIAQPNAIAVTATFAPITTFGGTTTVTVSATGGTTPYVASTIGTFVRADGSFTFTVTDANGCTGSATIVIAPFSTPVAADPGLGQMSFTTLANATQSASTLLFTEDYKLRIPFYNSNQDEIIPNGTISLKINLGSKLSLATGFNLATAPLSNYFTFTSATVADSVIITGVQNAAIPADLTSELVFNVKGRLSCTAKVTSIINVVNLSALLIDESLSNNTSAIQYTLPVTVSTTQVNVTCNGAANGIINVNASPGTTVVIKNAANTTVTNTGLVPGVYTITATALGDAPASNTCSSIATVTILQPLVLAATSSTTANNTCNAGADGKITVTSTGGTAPYSYTISGPTVNVSGATSGVFSFLTAGTYTITSKDANNCTATTTSIVTQPTGTAPNLALGSDFTNNFFATSGVSQTIVYNVTEIAGNPAVGDTIRITKVAGFNINLNTTIASATVNATTYTLDNARWKIDSSDPLFVSIILTNPLNATAPGTILCNQRVYVAVSLTRNTTDVSNFPLTARIRKANGELILSNNLNTIIMTAE